MPFDRAFDPETLSIMGRAFDAAWVELETGLLAHAGPQQAGLRRAPALRIMTAARLGQRDPERLKTVALGLVDQA